MNTFPTSTTLSRCLTGLGLMVLGASTALQAVDLDARLNLRPLTPQEIKDYTLGSAQRSGGLDTVGLGQPAYLEVLVGIDVPASENVTVSWVLTNKPMASTATLVTSPLGTNVPPFNLEDRAGGEFASKVAGRTMLRPDVVGSYTVIATVNSASSGSMVLTQKVTGATYMGRNTCGLCHSGGQASIASDKWGWADTGHAVAFQMAIDGISTDHFNPNCISCHVVGYDTNTNAVNGGWDDIAAQVGWTFPPNAVSNNWDQMHPDLQNVSNIQCENCHGPGSEHAYSLGKTDKISVSMNAGSCAQCHDSLTHHYKTAEWQVSKHARSVEETGSSCARCHEAQGFKNWAETGTTGSVEHENIGCAACHTLHDATNPHQLRTLADVTLNDTSKPGGPTVVTEGGNGKLCMQCHIARRDAVSYVNGSVNNRFGPHHGPQTDMLVGANAITYGQVIPSSAHYASVEDTCATCHMQALESGDAGFTDVGGHTFNLRSEDGTVETVEACRECHGDIETIDFARADYDGNGVVEGVQTEVKGLLHHLAMLLPPVGSPAIDDYGSYTNLVQKQGLYNYLFVEEDGSFGVHNVSYAVGILKASIAALTDDANNDKLPDSWQIQYFGDINNPDAAPYANPSGDGIPNWLKFYLGVNPLLPGVVLPDGVMLANATSEENSGGPTRIYTAAEIVFDTTAGVTYQVQGVSEMGGVWENVGSPVSGTGKAVSFMTPTRHNGQRFFQVVIVPTP